MKNFVQSFGKFIRDDRKRKILERVYYLEFKKEEGDGLIEEESKELKYLEGVIKKYKLHG